MLIQLNAVPILGQEPEHILVNPYLIDAVVPVDGNAKICRVFLHTREEPLYSTTTIIDIMRMVNEAVRKGR